MDVTQTRSHTSALNNQDQLLNAVLLKDLQLTGNSYPSFVTSACKIVRGMWQLSDFPKLWLNKLFIGDQEIILCIDETGDKKKGKSTDYTARQYIGNLGKTENGI